LESSDLPLSLHAEIRPANAITIKSFFMWLYFDCPAWGGIRPAKIRYSPPTSF
jgi:hypothetical protein